ncbi:MAG: restriction endonuclease [Ignavibacteriales bacterium]|nr:restriction endonuclease [Ignavibacteriales bacterium]
MPITAHNLVHSINQLSKQVHYNYINQSTSTKVIIENVVIPEGPIVISRYDPQKGEGPHDAKKSTISPQMIWRVANAITENYPINIDRVLGASYNTRSVLETLLAHTPEFYYCFPGRIESISSSTAVRPGHKHLLYNPNNPHTAGTIQRIETNIVISEIPAIEAVYDSVIIPETQPENQIDINMQRRHAQIQIALLKIGLQLGSRVWIAQNDRGMQYEGTRIAEMAGVINTLHDERLITAYDDAIRAALMIDVIWFRNSRFMPAVFEVEHSTGVTSGLARMQNFKDRIPEIRTRWVIVANNDLREQVFRLANQPQFLSLNTKYMSYTSVEELYSLCQRRHITGVTDDFLDCFMESCIS